MAAGVPLAVAPDSLLAAENREAALAAAMATVTETELLGHAGLLADDSLEGREAGTRGGLAAARYIESRLQEAGVRPAGDGGRFAQRFNGNMQNLLAVLSGSDPNLADEYIVLGAHYDHVGYGTRRNSNGPVGYIHNGADDNASGVAAVLEVVDALTAIDFRPRRSILFAFWDGEEKNLLGSRHWVRQPTVPVAQVVAAINIDMVGRLRNGQLIVGGTRTGYGSRQLLSSPRLPRGMAIDFTWEFKENSDHWPFAAAGIPSFVVNTGLHDDYHCPSDDLEKLNVPGMRQAAQYLVDVTMRLADADTLPKFRAAGQAETPSLRLHRERPLSPLPPRTPVEWAAPANGETDGVLVVSPGSVRSTDASMLQAGDRVVACDGVRVRTVVELESLLLVADKSASLQVIRRGAEEPELFVLALAGRPLRIGASWRSDEAEPGSVWVTRVVPSSAAARAGLAVGDRIDRVAGESFVDADGLLARLRELLASDAAEIALRVETAGRVRTVIVDVSRPLPRGDDATL